MMTRNKLKSEARAKDTIQSIDVLIQLETMKLNSELKHTAIPTPKHVYINQGLGIEGKETN